LPYLQNLLKSTDGKVAIMNRSESEISGRDVLNRKIKQFLGINKSTVLLADKEITSSLLCDHNFMLVSYKTWNDISENDKVALQQMPSTLIISK
jgi:hypothetical protein